MEWNRVQESFRGCESNRQNLIINSRLPEHQQTVFVINQLNCNKKKCRKKIGKKLKKIENLQKLQDECEGGQDKSSKEVALNTSNFYKLEL